MSALLKQRPRYNVAAFVEYIRPFPDDERWELIAGEAILMSPQTLRHQGIVSNLMAICRKLARPRGCREYPGLGTLNDAIDDYARSPTSWCAAARGEGRLHHRSGPDRRSSLALDRRQ